MIFKSGITKVLFSTFALCSIAAVSTAGETNQLSANFFTQKLTQNVRDQFNSHLLRLRREVTQSSSVQSGIRFKVGSCQLDDFLHSAKNCSKAFYTAIRQKDSTRKQCGKEHKKLRECMQNILTSCIEDSTVAFYLTATDVREITRNFLIFLGNERFWCEDGGLGISSDYLPAGSMCDLVFYQLSKGCTSEYNKLFNSTASDEKLCRAYQKAKKCYLRTIFGHCTFSRLLRQIVEIVVELTADFQPFCKFNTAQERMKLEDLFMDKKCPPYSLADVAFAMDVTNGTDRWQYVVMKRIIERISDKMDYGWRGIQTSVFQFDTQLRRIIKFDGPESKQLFNRYVRRMTRTTSKVRNKSKRLTGRCLSQLARSTFSPGKSGNNLIKKPWRSGQRPHNTAVVFVLTTGQSNDAMEPGLELLKDRNVHVVFVGPSNLAVPTTSNKILGASENSAVRGVPGSGIYRIIETKYKINEVADVVKDLTQEICLADRWRQLKNSERFSEGRVNQLKWGSIQDVLLRFDEYDMSLLFELKPIVAANPQTTTPRLRPSTTPFDPNNIDEGMDGDYYVGPPLPGPGQNPRMWPFYMSENEYNQEAPY